MMMNNNTMFQELNDNELDMVNGGGTLNELVHKVAKWLVENYFTSEDDSGVSGSW